MINKNIMILTIILFGLLAISSVSAANNITDDVVGDSIDDVNIENQNNILSLNNENNILKTNPKTFADLNDTINGNNDSDIYLEDNYTFNEDTDSNFNYGVIISRAVTIHGNNCTLNGAKQAEIFKVTGNNVVFKDIIFTNASKRAIYWSDSSRQGSVLGCTFVNNSAVYNGGAIYCYNAYNVSVSDCYFVNNSAGTSGGAIMFSKNSHGAISGCTFVNNSAGASGGAVYISYYGIDISISNCSFVNNSAYSKTGSGGTGGAIHWQECSNGSISGCSFVNNSAIFSGGAIYGCQYFDNLSVSDCSFVNNSAIYGGAIYFYFDVGCSIFKCSFVNNTAFKSKSGVDGFGGAIYWLQSSNASASDCSFVNNSAVYGGACYWDGTSINSSFSGCSFVNNSAINGSAIWTNGNNCIFDSIFADNKANCSGLNCVNDNTSLIFTFLGCDNYINAIYAGQYANLTFTNVTYYNGVMSNSDDIEPICSLNEAGINITLEVFDSSENLVDNVTIMTNGTGQSTYDYLKLTGGNYEYVAYHRNDNYYNYIDVNGSFNVVKIDPNMEVNVNNVSRGDNVTINIALEEDARGNINITIGDITEIIALSDDVKGDICYNIANLGTGNYTVYVTYSGDYKYNNQNVIKMFSVELIASNLTASDVSYDYHDYGYVTACLTNVNGYPVEGANITIYLSSENTTLTSDADGQVKFPIEGLLPGTYNATFTYAGQSVLTASAKVVINKIDTTLNAPQVNAIYKDGSKLVATLKDANGNAISDAKLKVAISGGITKYIRTDDEGQGTLDISNFYPGKYWTTITFVSTQIYNKATASTKFTVKIISNLTAGDLITDYGSGDNLIARLTDSDGESICDASVSVQFNGTNLTLTTDDNGEVSVSSDGLVPGNYSANFTFVGDEYYIGSNAIANIIVNKMDATLSSDDVNMIYGDGSKLVATLKDANGNAIGDAKLKVAISGGITKYIRTDANGQVALSLNSLGIGTYRAAITFVATDLYNKASTTSNIYVNKMNTTLTAPDITTGHNSGNLVATLKDANGNAISGAKIKIVLNKVAKYITTDANGQVTLSLKNLDVGNYTATITFVATDLYNKATTTAKVVIVEKISTSLTAPDVTANYKDESKLIATLKDTNGNVISGAKIKIVLNKVAKYITTDANGQVALSLKNLDVGNYTTTITFVATDLYNKATTTAKVTIK